MPLGQFEYDHKKRDRKPNLLGITDAFDKARDAYQDHMTALKEGHLGVKQYRLYLNESARKDREAELEAELAAIQAKEADQKYSLRRY